ncbi:MAG: TerB family tellurite resistance protein [Candidatus Sericytochromatia bacterium]|nr:TerB family tellurite resistance protein [Candidatus Sericytochromatia bacterium]
MFLNRFNDLEKRGFLDLALLAVRADDAITTEEVQFVEELRLGLGISEEDFVQHILSDPDFERAVASFELDESRRLAFLELVALMYADGQYDPAESLFLRRVQAAFGLDEQVARLHHGWARRYMQLRTDALALISGTLPMA